MTHSTVFDATLGHGWMHFLIVERDPSVAAQFVFVIGGAVVFALLVSAMTVYTIRRVNRQWKDKPPTMTMQFNVGSAQKPLVDVAFTQPTERLVVRVDGVELINQGFAAGFRLTRSVEFPVGSSEPHAVRMMKRRELIYGTSKPQQFSAYVDGNLVAEAESSF